VDAIDLPESNDDIVDVEIPEDAMKVYRDIEDDFIVGVEDGTISVPNALVERLRLHQCTSGDVKTDQGDVIHLHDAKRDALTEFLRDLPPEEPIVIPYKFTSELAAIRSACDAVNRPCAEVSGAKNEWEVFQFGVTEGGVIRHPYSAVAVQVQAGSEAIDLFRACYMFFYTTAMSHKQYTQMRRRILRNGQTRPCFFLHAIAMGTVDEIAWKNIKKGQAIDEAISEGILRNRRAVAATP
jgi:hypothetical protein